ncbi:MAG: sigma-70 family RNA polymerase sigma factor [Planctomycetota bacterium]
MARTELDLWTRWCDRRDQGAFQALVAAHEAFVYDFARRLTGHAADAEDLTQEAFLELAGAERDKPPAVGLRAFLGRRLVLGSKMLKRASLTRQRLEPRARPPAPVHPEDAVENREAAEAALAELDPEMRQALVLRFLHGLSYDEVAHVLGVKEGAARVRVHRGLGKLKERFGPRAQATVAGLVLFAPQQSLAAPTAKAAVLLGGAIVMSTVKKWSVVARLALLMGGGAVVWRNVREEPATPVRATTPLVTEVPPSLEPVEKPDVSDQAVTSVSLDAPIPKGRASVFGRVRFRDGSPAAGYRLSLSGSPAHVVTTDAEGRYHIHDEWVSPRDLCIRGPLDYSFCVAHAPLREDERIEVDVVLERGFTVSARVTRKDDGGPVKRARVYLRSNNHDRKQGRWGWLLLDDEGRLRFDHVPAGSYQLQVVESPGLESVSRLIEVEDHLDVAIALRTSRPFIVQFENLPAAWRGANATLSFYRMGGPHFSISARGVALDAQDRLVVDAPPPGKYHITLLRSGGPLPRVDFGEYVVTSATLEPVVHRFPYGARVQGRIVHPDGAPLAERSLSLGGAKGTTDGDGRFEIPFVKQGRHGIWIGGDGLAKVRVGVVEVPPSGGVRADVRIRGTAALTGTFDRDAPRMGGSVELYRPGAKEAIARWDFGSRREFRIPHLEAGEYELRTWSIGSAESSKRIFVEEGASMELGELKLASFPKFPVRIVAPSDRTLPRTFCAIGSSPKTTRSVTFDLEADGSGTVRGVMPGEYDLWFTINGFQHFRRKVVLKEGMDPIEIRLESAPMKVDVAVRLEMTEDLPIPDVIQVRALGRDGTADGWAFLTFPRSLKRGRLQLVPGRYTLQIRYEGWAPLDVDVELTADDQAPIRLRVSRPE